jgi:hypothetical protein
LKHVPKETTDESLIQEFLNNGGKISHGKTKPPAAELGLSNNQWNNKLTKEEKAARDKKHDCFNNFILNAYFRKLSC